uniref:RRM domain-containing protein n=1 Tax=Guillardia theta (strain CCMP2712) TaxID=905079 RepID=A0A0C3SJH4_GUITC
MRFAVGNLPLDIRTRDVEDLFYKYGRLPTIPPAFAFVSFEYPEDAEDAVRGRADGVMFEGQRLRVEMSRSSQDGYVEWGGSWVGKEEDGGRASQAGNRAPPRDLRRSDHRIIISGLPPSASWQDLKDFFRSAGEVIFSDVDRQGGGIVEFANKSDQEYAISKVKHAAAWSLADVDACAPLLLSFLFVISQVRRYRMAQPEVSSSRMEE